ncbi:MAG TPA: helix-turn-helix transcriptional regulator [Actinomycetota bacterium]|nr:helix-turn-helix transcriptional regulator [Actinomycetota bacterium]
MMPNDVIAARVREAREAAGYTQAQLGELLEPYFGRRWSPQEVSGLETGLRRRIYAGEVVAFADIFERPIAWFYTPPDPRIPFEFPGGKRVLPERVLGERTEARAQARDFFRSVGGLFDRLAAEPFGWEVWEAPRDAPWELLFRKRWTWPETGRARRSPHRRGSGREGAEPREEPEG